MSVQKISKPVQKMLDKLDREFAELEAEEDEWERFLQRDAMRAEEEALLDDETLCGRRKGIPEILGDTTNDLWEEIAPSMGVGMKIIPYRLACISLG